MTRGTPALVALLLAAFVINLDTTLVNVALPTLVGQIHAGTTQLQWVVDAYNLVFAALLLAAGSLSDRLGRKGVLLVGLGVFASASIAGGFASTPSELIGARAVMGLGAALTFPATLSLLSNIFVERRARARAIGLWGASAGVAIAMGPIVGGWLLEHFAWPSVFFALAPVAAAAAGLIALWVPTSRDAQQGGVDLGGAVLATAAMGLLVFSIIEAPTTGWSSARTLAGFAGSVALATTFVLYERRLDRPMLDVGLFRNPRFSAASASVTVSLFTCGLKRSTQQPRRTPEMQCHPAECLSRPGVGVSGQWRRALAGCTAKDPRLAGRYWRSKPFVFSLLPRCQGLLGSQK